LGEQSCTSQGKEFTACDDVGPTILRKQEMRLTPAARRSSCGAQEESDADERDARDVKPQQELDS
jgi:hypothetical protein